MPAGYVTGVAYEAIIAFIRSQQEDRGYTQPQFWLLRNLSPNDLSPDGRGMSIAELRDAMSTYLRKEDDLESEARVLLEKGWLERDESDHLSITPTGETALAGLKQFAPAIRAMLHQGIDDADYATTVRVLTQLIENAGGRLS
ncbi:hypothetical protein FB381_3013 [Nocardioides albertanoniae]|uniref:DNA-binding MarR family transcriptional regulator n=2 Tax=Nocardioides albertanoniae TaxID=1175486 RepID=A0A543A949_9ACTN|nr:hypothetical protein FB381_3013 [Nocardioides albertanoniae]